MPRDPGWLDEVQQPPAKLMLSLPKLRPLLIGKRGRPIQTLDDRARCRLELLGHWKEFLGPLAVERGEPPRFEVLDYAELPGVVRMRIDYEVEPGCRVEAYLLRPIEASRPLPGVLVFHSTVPQTIRQPAGIEGEPEKAFGLKLARRGYVCSARVASCGKMSRRVFFSGLRCGRSASSGAVIPT